MPIAQFGLAKRMIHKMSQFTFVKLETNRIRSKNSSSAFELNLTQALEGKALPQTSVQSVRSII